MLYYPIYINNRRLNKRWSELPCVIKYGNLRNQK